MQAESSCRAALVSFVVALAGCITARSTAADDAQVLLLRGPRVVDVATGAVLAPQDVLIREGLIAAVTPVGTSQPPSDARVVQAANTYLIPGLWDFHAHALKADRWERTRRLLLAHGVTGFRDPNTTRPFAEVAALREEIRTGRLLAPRFVTSGPLIDGPRPIFEQFWSVGTPDEARAAVARLDQGGMDFVKVYTRLPRDCFFAIADEARRRGLPLAGHVPLELTAAEASNAGMRFIEHSYRHRMDACSAEAEIRTRLREQVDAIVADDWQRQYRLEQEAFHLGIETYDAHIAEELGRCFARNGTWFTPTLVEMGARFRPEVMADEDAPLAALFEDPRLQSVPPAETRKWLQQMSQERGWFWGRVDLAGEDADALRRETQQEVANRLRMVVDLHRGGGGILAGTDAAYSFPFVFFGSSLHEELELLVKAGLTPLETLQSATLLPARALGLENELGTIAPGKAADLVLLDANPLEDIRNTAQIHAVVRGGVYLDRQQLDRLLDEARTPLITE